ncbi:MAG: hypothetical protein AAGA39_08040 [Pseudomonadota bacterium]
MPFRKVPGIARLKTMDGIGRALRCKPYRAGSSPQSLSVGRYNALGDGVCC